MVKSNVFTEEVLKALRESKVDDLAEVMSYLAMNEDLSFRTGRKDSGRWKTSKSRRKNTKS